jgi:hypothetical protein
MMDKLPCVNAKIGNTEKLAAHDEEKQHKNTTQYEISKTPLLVRYQYN